MIDRRHFTTLLAASAAATAIPAIPSGAVEIGEDGLHIQPFFMQTFLDLAEDKAEAEAEGKHFAVIFEQRGCPYCREMHEVNFARPEIADYVSSHFGILQLNMWGNRAVTDLDGEEIEEKDLARKWRVNFTPTIVFFGPGGNAEVMRMPGYFKPFHFISMFEYVQGGHYEGEPFQRFLQARFDRMKEAGEDPDLW